MDLLGKAKSVEKELNFVIYLLGMAILSFLFFSFFIGMIKLLIGFSIGKEDIFLSLTVCVFLLFLLGKKTMTSATLQIGIPVFVSLLLLLLLFLCISYESKYFAMDWDSNTYHKSAVGFLKNGWNPFAESAESFCQRLFHNESVCSSSIWIDHYPKATWIMGGQIYDLTGNIESGKAYQLFGIAGVFFLTLSYLIKKGYTWLASVSVSFLLSLNPISYVQILSYYVDGFMFSMFWILLIGLLRWLDEADEKRESWYFVVTAMCLLSNVKFTGLLYGGVFCFCAYLFFVSENCIRDKKRADWKKMIVWCGHYLGLAVLSVGVFGYPTYITNLIHHKSFTYPLSGEGAIDIISGIAPKGFAELNTFEKLFYSLFGEYENLQYSWDKELPTLKIPFTVTSNELKVQVSSASTISGFGLFFSGLLIVGIAVNVIYMIRNRKKKRTIALLLGYDVISIGLLAAIEDGWWARYAPFVYLIPVIALLILFKGENQKKYGPVLSVIVLIFLCNNLYMGKWNTYVKQSSEIAKEQMEYFLPYEIDIASPNQFYGKLFNFEDIGINYNLYQTIDGVEGECYFEPCRISITGNK